MTTTNTYGRQTVVPLTNKSGGGVIAGDVVVVDTTNNDSFTTTTSASSTAILGIAQETIASNAVGRVLTAGYAALVNVNASVTRGHYGITHTVAKQATDGGTSRTTGTFCQFLTGGTTPDALVFNPDLASGTGLGAWTDFTPTITAGGGGFAIGNGVLQGRYKLLDANTAQISIFYQRGSTTTNGTGQYSVALPVTAKITKPQVQVLHGYVLDSGTMYYSASALVINNTASVSTVIVADSGSVHEWSATNPVVPATGDELGLSGILEI